MDMSMNSAEPQGRHMLFDVKIGEEAAKKLFEAETKGFSSYQAYLEDQKRQLEWKVMTGVASTAEKQEFEDIGKAIIQSSKDETEERMR